MNHSQVSGKIVRWGMVLYAVVFTCVGMSSAGPSGVGEAAGLATRDQSTEVLRAAKVSERQVDPAELPSAGWHPGHGAAPLVTITPGEANDHWYEGFGVRGMSSSVRALALDGQGNLYAGGEFTSTGEVGANHISRWDGTAWHPLGEGVNDDVTDLAFDGQGNLYAAGRFTTAGGISAEGIARWDGTSWHALGVGVDGFVSALEVDGQGNLYAGGGFNTAGGVAAKHIARWDGTSWHALGEGMAGYVAALTWDGQGNLYAGWNLYDDYEVIDNGIARWDGTTWHTLGKGLGGGVAALVVDGQGNLYAGWNFQNEWTSSYGIARWDGVDWHRLAEESSGRWDGLVHALAVDGQGNLYTGGWFDTAGEVTAYSIARWDGAAWHPLGSGISGDNYHDHTYAVDALVVDGQGYLYAGGGFFTAGGVSASHIARWDGSAWSSLGEEMNVGIGGVVAALAFDGQGNLYAGGSFTSAGGVNANNIACWDGEAWHSLGSGLYGDEFSGVDALAVDEQGNLYAGGSFNTASGISVNNIARWDGTTWHPLGEGMGEGMLGYVSALALDGQGNLYVGGVFSTDLGESVQNIARWDGVTWHTLGEGIYGFVYALTWDGQGNLYAGGDFTTAGGVSALRIARWDGAAWYPLGKGLDGEVDSLAMDGQGNLYAGGGFNAEGGGGGGVSVNNIARWDGTTWHSLGKGMGSSVRALALDGQGNLYAGGWFDTAGEISANQIARWDGITWGTLGDGVNNGVYALAVDEQGYLYAGGNFTTAGGKPSNHIARWKKTLAEDDTYRTPAGVTLQVAAPGVLSNDDDAEGDQLSAVLEESPATGSLDFKPDGSFSYIPEEDYRGLVTFKYRVNANDGGFDSAEVTIEVFTRFYLPISQKK